MIVFAGFMAFVATGGDINVPYVLDLSGGPDLRTVFVRFSFGEGTLQWAEHVEGPWMDDPLAYSPHPVIWGTSPCSLVPPVPARFYRLAQY
jgi:hypothetical protein